MPTSSIEKISSNILSRLLLLTNSLRREGAFHLKEYLIYNFFLLIFLKPQVPLGKGGSTL